MEKLDAKLERHVSKEKEEVIEIDMAILMKRIEQCNSDDNAIFGYLPMM